MFQRLLLMLTRERPRWVETVSETVVDADLGETEVGGDFFRDCC